MSDVEQYPVVATATASPATLPCLRRVSLDMQRWTRTAIDNPVVVLINTSPHIGLLLAKHHTIAASISLEAVRWIRLPIGWKLWWTKWQSRFSAQRLPDEWLFNEVVIERRDDLIVAKIAPEMRDGPLLPHPSMEPYPLKQLSCGQFELLSSCSGRLLMAQAESIFPALTTITSIVNPRPRTLPWPRARLFAG